VDPRPDAQHHHPLDPAKKIAEQGLTKIRDQASPSNLDKRNLALLRGTDDQLKRAVTVDVARRFGGVGRRAIEKAVKKGSLESEGEGPNRRIIVQSLLKYFPPKKHAN
jgi:hypothetical protein